MALTPTLVAEDTAAWMSPLERTTLLREIDAQLCFEMSERYEIAAPDGVADAKVRAILSHVRATGRVS